MESKIDERLNTREKRLFVADAVDMAQRIRDTVESTEKQIVEARKNIAFWEQQLTEAEQLKKQIDARLKEYGFHDSGHAKGELQKFAKENEA